MKLSDYIELLQGIQNANGDLEVFQQGMNTTLGSIAPARIPLVMEVARLTKRESNPRHVLSIDGTDRRTGRMIVYVGR